MDGFSPPNKAMHPSLPKSPGPWMRIIDIKSGSGRTWKS